MGESDLAPSHRRNNHFSSFALFDMPFSCPRNSPGRWPNMGLFPVIRVLGRGSKLLFRRGSTFYWLYRGGVCFPSHWFLWSRIARDYGKLGNGGGYNRSVSTRS